MDRWRGSSCNLHAMVADVESTPLARFPTARLMSGADFVVFRRMDRIGKVGVNSPKPAKLVAPASSGRRGSARPQLKLWLAVFGSWRRLRRLGFQHPRPRCQTRHIPKQADQAATPPVSSTLHPIPPKLPQSGPILGLLVALLTGQSEASFALFFTSLGTPPL